MKRLLPTLVTVIAAAMLVFSGCGLLPWNNEQIDDTVMEDLAELQSMIPAIEAGLAVAVADGSIVETQSMSIQTFDPNLEVNAVAGTPAEYYAAAGSSGRYPAAANSYIADFYGIAGNKAYLTIEEEGTGGLYRVDLYIYPTLSTTVYYVHEEYLVAGTGWSLVDAAGSADPLAYISNETVYFDGRVQSNDVQWTRYSGTSEQYYDSIDVEDDATNLLYYDYPSDPLAEEPARLAAGAGDGNYSARVVSTIADPAGQGTLSTDVVEYYTEVSGVGSSALSFVDKTYTNGKLSTSDKTVRRYSQDPDGNKTVRARTVSEFTYGSSFSSTTILTEATDVAVTAAGVTTFSSVTTATRDGSSTAFYTISVDLTETGADTDEFSGTMTYAPVSGSSTAYDIVVSAADGLVIEEKSSKKSKTSFSAMSRKEFRDVVSELSNGGVFSGKIKGGKINGLYKLLTKEVDVEISLAGMLAIMGEESKAK